MAVLIGIACLIGCRGGPPVQEMSDARQAIAAARTAGAPTGSTELAAANAAISRAEDHLQAGEYTRARYAALQAKHHATAALNNTHQTASAPATVPN